VTGLPAGACAALGAPKSEATRSEAAKSNDVANRHCRNFVTGIIVACDSQSRLFNAPGRSALAAPIRTPGGLYLVTGFRS
jgi:hypothetical protein